MVDYYNDLLKLCGFDDDEIKKQKPRIDTAFQRLGLGAEEMKTAEQWVRQNHDVRLVGVQKLLRAWLKELFDLVLARDEGKKIVYYGFPSIGGPGMAIKIIDPENLYVSCPDVVLCHTLGHIFNQLNPVLEAGEENGLPAGHSLCSLQQVRVGALAKGIIPVPDMVLTSSYYCDMGSKTDELLHERYGHHAVYIDGSMDSRWGEFPHYHPQRVEYLGAQLNKLFDAVNEILGVKVTRDASDKATATTIHLSQAIGNLTRVMMADPLPISSVETGLAVQLSAASTDIAMTDGAEAIDILYQEASRRVEEGFGIVEKGAPRVLNFASSHSDPTIDHMMENAGLALAATITTLPPPTIRPIPYTTLGEIRADVSMQAGFYHSSYGVVKRFADAIKDLNLDGVIWGYQYNCRPLAQPSHYLKRWVEETTGIPVLPLEMDFYDSRNYSAAALRTRVEAFAEMLRMKKATAKV